MQILLLIALLAGSAWTAPVRASDDTLSCSAALSTNFILPDGSGSVSGSCSCLATCTQDSTCCSDVDTFAGALVAFATARPGSVPLDRTTHALLAKTEPSAALYRPYGDSSALVAYRQCSFTRLTEQDVWIQSTCGDEYDVVGYDLVSGQFVPFEEVVQVEQPLRAGFGTDKVSSSSDQQFFAEMTGDAAVNTMKTALTGLKMCGFSASLPQVPAGKLDWDPTPNRTWAISVGHYELVPQQGIEIHAMTPGQLDANYTLYAMNGQYLAQSWAYCFLRDILSGDNWQSMLADDGQTYQALQSL
ncbi:hypothetical protein RI367_006656 [Sorochytrium milnesiophthora]